MAKNFTWWVAELIIWYAFFYLVIYSIKNPVNIGVSASLLVLLSSLGIFASPLTRHLSVWNKIIDRIMKKEDQEGKY